MLSNICFCQQARGAVLKQCVSAETCCVAVCNKINCLAMHEEWLWDMSSLHFMSPLHHKWSEMLCVLVALWLQLFAMLSACIKLDTMQCSGTLFHESACFQKSAWHVHRVVEQISENACT